MLRIYLKPEGWDDPEYEELRNRFKVEADKIRPEDHFIQISTFPINILSPAWVSPDIPADHIAKVTFLDQIYDGFVPPGLYGHGQPLQVEILVETQKNGTDNSMYQQVSMVGPSIDLIEEAYDLLRSGMMEPDCLYRGDTKPKETPETEAEEPAAEATS